MVFNCTVLTHRQVKSSVNSSVYTVHVSDCNITHVCTYVIWFDCEIADLVPSNMYMYMFKNVRIHV